jgi:hypothetical protein
MVYCLISACAFDISYSQNFIDIYSEMDKILENYQEGTKSLEILFNRKEHFIPNPKNFSKKFFPFLLEYKYTDHAYI